MLRVVKMDQGATDICCWWYVFMQMGIHNLEQCERPILASSDSHLYFVFQEAEERILS